MKKFSVVFILAAIFVLVGCEKEEIDLSGSRLPIVYITTPAKIVSKEDWVKSCRISICNSGGNDAVYENVQIKGRGNSTWRYPKKPYAIKLDKKEEVLGMPRHKRWVLLANYLDHTCLRNDVSFEIARCMPGLAWTPHGEFVEVVMNGEPLGNYYLCEQIKVDQNRLNITGIGPTDIDDVSVTGGYVFELDINYDELYKFTTSYQGLPVQFKDPDENIAAAQMNYVQNYFNRIENMLYGGNSTGENLFDYIDMDSFIDWWLVHELTGNGEPNHPKSCYMYKDRNGKLCAGPVWDFDYATFKPSTPKSLIISSSLWYGALMKNAAFTERVKERWTMHKSSLEQIEGYIDMRAAQIKESAEMNMNRWSNKKYDYVNEDTKLSFPKAVDRLKQGYRQRMEVLDKVIETL